MEFTKKVFSIFYFISFQHYSQRLSGVQVVQMTDLTDNLQMVSNKYYHLLPNGK